MQPQAPSTINMAPIMAALQRRQMGVPAPMSQQVSTGSGMPMQGQPQPNASMSAMPSQVQQGGAPQAAPLKAGQQAQGPNFDPETRDLAKSLVQRLLKGL